MLNARQREFRDLHDRLRMSAADVAKLVGRARTTCLQYRSAGEYGRTPPESVLVTLRAAWEERQHQNLTDAIALIRSRGWDINWATLEETQDEVEAAVREHGWRRPSFLPPAQKRKVRAHVPG